MKNQYHILNGDCLKEQFPKDIFGEYIVTRECFVDGDVQGNSLAELFATRAKFIGDSYKGYCENDYYQNSVSEFEKIQNIPKDAELNLWFEDDLFCQVNFWFIIYLLKVNNKNYSLYLIRPKSDNVYSFGSMSEADLIIAFQNKTQIELSEFQQLSKLWKLYQHNDCEEMIKTAEKLQNKYPFLIPAIKAHIERRPREGRLGRPAQTLISIIGELKTNEFEPIFREFCKRESIYGFGDLQVKRLFDEIKNNR